MKLKASDYRKRVAKRRARTDKGNGHMSPRGHGNAHKKSSYRNRRNQLSGRSWR